MMASYEELESSESEALPFYVLKFTQGERCLILTNYSYIMPVLMAAGLMNASDQEQMFLPVLEFTDLLRQRFSYGVDESYDNPLAAEFFESIGKDITPSDGYLSIFVFPFKSSSFENSSESRSTELSIYFPAQHPLAIEYMNPEIRAKTELRIWRFHEKNLQDMRLYWMGTLSGVSRESETTVNLRFTSPYARLFSATLNERYSKFCRHVLYGPKCKVNRVAYTTEATITEQDGIVVQVPQAAAKPDGYYSNGVLVLDTFINLGIIRHYQESLVLSAPLPAQYSSLLPRDVKILAGCDLSMTTCLGRFNNLNNYGGFPFIPIKTPFGGASIYVV
jgi:uncharacterized phage protein (TIGR02218 family)